MKGEVDVQLSPYGLLLLTQPLHSSEQHTRANLEFSSNFGLKGASKFTLDYVLLSFKTEGILPLSSCPLCDAAAYIETFFLLSAWHNQSLEAKLQMKCCYLLKGYVHKQQFCCPWTRYEIKVVSTGIE